METRSQVITNKKAPILPLYGWVIVLGLLAWSIWTLWPRQQAVVDMPYSTFLEQVQAGNVSQVTFTGSDITGTLVNPQPITGSAVPTAYSSTFHTRFPEVAGDSNLVTLLMIHRVQVNAEPSPQPWYLSLLTDRLPLLLLAATAIYIFTRVSQRQPALLNFNGKAQRIYSIEHPRTTFNDVAGDDEAKTQIRELINPLRRSSNDDLTGAKIPRGVLLVGMPGTGKRLLARAAAGEMKTPLIYICASALAQMEIGTGPNQIHSLFQQARKMAPSIIFIDELEALGCQENRVNRSEPEPTPVLNQLFWEMEHLNERAQILVLAATHRPDQLEPALLKPGRFDRQIAVDLPDRAGREGILKIHTRDLRLSKNVNLGIIARSTTGLSGADLAKLCQEASQAAARKNTDQVSMADFEEALDRILLTAPRQLLSDQERRVAAYHEAGHVLVAWLTAPADPIHAVTIMPRLPLNGPDGDTTEDNLSSHSKSYLLARLAVLLGGRGAEEVGAGEVTTRSEDDLAEATRLARCMVTRWGMGRIGPVTLEKRNGRHPEAPGAERARDYSEETAAQIDHDIQELLQTSYAEVCKLLNTSRVQLDHLAEALLKDETLNQAELARILGSRPFPISADINPPVDVSDLDQRQSRGS